MRGDVQDDADDQAVTDSAVLALLVVVGVLLGAVGLLFTPLHVAGTPVPVGALLSIVVLPWLVARAGGIDPRPGYAAAPLAAWAVVVGALGLLGPGGDVLLPLTWQSLVLTVGGTVAGLLALRRVVVGGA